MKIRGGAPLRGAVTVPGDKSISHRALMLGAVAEGKTVIDHLLTGDDCLSTIACLRTLGVNIVQQGAHAEVEGAGPDGLRAPVPGEPALLYTGNSGTTTRLLCGLLAGQRFDSVLSGDESVARRPMGRVVEPLRKMGAEIETGEGMRCPLRVRGRPLSGIRYRLPVASAQLKSALLLAGLYADGETAVLEDVLSRDHTERMLRAMGADIRTEPGAARVRRSRLRGLTIDVPGDLSSAAFFLVAASVVPGSELSLRRVGVNPTRTGILDALRAMGADITVCAAQDGPEPTADLRVRYAPLRGAQIGGGLIPRLIDELPALAVAAACARGETVIRDAAELRHKETDRIETTADMLRAAGVQVRTTDGGMVIAGGGVSAGRFESRGDHRIAMSAAVLALAARGESEIAGAEDVSVSYPSFFETLEEIVR